MLEACHARLDAAIMLLQLYKHGRRRTYRSIIISEQVGRLRPTNINKQTMLDSNGAYISKTGSSFQLIILINHLIWSGLTSDLRRNEVTNRAH